MSTNKGAGNAKGRLPLFAYRVVASALRPLIRRHLNKRVRQGKEDPQRWIEKLGHPSAPRPQGPLVWLHAVGLGEAMALRGIIAGIESRWPTAHFLATSSTFASAQLLAENMPARTTHQFLPVDVPRFVARFLDHWRPDISIWTEQDLWPICIDETAKRGIPLAFINARISAESARRRMKFPAVFRGMIERFDIVYAQNAATAEFIADHCDVPVQVAGAAKSLGPALAYSESDLAQLLSEKNGRFVWVGASTHPADEELLIATHCALRKHLPDAMLVIVPRDPKRAKSVIKSAMAAGLGPAGTFDQSEGVFVDGRFGTLGLWYRLADAAFIGGTLDDVEGHNPWEAIAVACPVLHGPRTKNFDVDFRTLGDAYAALCCETSDAVLAGLLDRQGLSRLALAGTACREHQQRTFGNMFDDIVRLAQ